MPALNLLGPAYQNDSLPVSAQDTVNWIPEIVQAEGRNRVYFRGVPGAVSFASLSGAGRGAIVAGDVAYIVMGTKAYRLDADGTATELGTVPGNGFVGMGANRTQVVIVNGDAGYIITLADDSFEEITDEDFGSPATTTFINNYMAFEGVNGGVAAGTKGIFYVSDLNDASAYTATSFATAQSDPDDVVAVASIQNVLFVFGTRTTEQWVDIGASGFPLAVSQGQTLTEGCGAKYSIQPFDNTLAWLDQDGVVRIYRDAIAQRVSTHAIEQDIQAVDFSQCTSWQYRDKGHLYYGLQLPNGKTFVYDAAFQQWHRRKSYQVDRWRMAVVFRAYNKLIGLDYADGTVWELSDSYYTEGDDPLIAERMTQYIHANQSPMFLQSLELVFDTGNAALTGDPEQTQPVVEMRYSDDFGRTFSDFRQRSLGLTGQYAKAIRFHGLGRFINRLFHIRVSDPVKRDWVAAEARATTGFRA